MNATPSESFVLFELAGCVCGVRSQTVQSVEIVDHVTALPNAVPFVEGVAFSRGQIIPCLNLRVRLGFPRISRDQRSRMLVVRLQERTAGVLVDSSREFVSLSPEGIQSPGEVEELQLCGFCPEFLEGIATLGDRVVLILNLKEVFEGI